MTGNGQRIAAIAGALLLFAVFVAANAHLLRVAIGSQPDCVLRDGATPARRVC